MRKIDRYRIFAEIQRGPITTVYKAYQEDLARVVLLKVLNREWAEERDLVERFRQEGQASARIRHPNVVNVFDFGMAEGAPYLVTEFVEGRTLAELISERGPVPVELALYIAREVATGLAAVHAKGIVHRDVKPANIFLSEEGEVRLGDFGLAAECGQSGAAVAGTPAYLAPEVVAEGSPGPAADLFALGVTLYEMLVAENPFADRTPSRTLHHVVNLAPPPVRRLRPEVPADLERLCHRLLAKDPTRRPSSASDVEAALLEIAERHEVMAGAQDLCRFLQEPDSYMGVSGRTITTTAEGRHPPTPDSVEAATVTAAPPPMTAAPHTVVPDRTAAGRRRRRALWPAIAAAAIVVVVGGAALIVRQGGPAVQPSDGQPETAPAQQPMPATMIPESSKVERESMPIEEQVTQSLVVVPPPQKETRPPEETIAPPPDSLSTPAAPVARGWLRWAVDPPSIAFLDQDSVGVLRPSDVVEVEAGEHRLCLRPPGWPTVCKTVTVAVQETLALEISLWGEVGYLQVTVAPWGEIWIDGNYVDRTPLLRPLIILPGEHVLEVRHPTLGARLERFVAVAGDTLRRRFRLSPNSP